MLQSINSQNKKKFWTAISILWASAIIFPLIYFPISQYPAGHPWKVELTFSLFLTLCLGYLLLFEHKPNWLSAIQTNTKIWVICPFIAFIGWSAVSIFWANSVPSVIHHTLVWFCYLAFMSVSGYLVNNRRYLKMSVISLSLTIGIISLICITEYSFSPSIGETFGFRYGRYAEIFATLLPFFFAYNLRLRKRNLMWSMGITVLLTIALLFSNSRASLVSAIVGLSIFDILRILSKPGKKELIQGLVVLVLLFLVGFGVTSFFSNSEGKGSAITRLTHNNENDTANSITQNVRFTIWGVSKEMFERNKLLGVGADNFGTEFNHYRAYFTSKPENQYAAAQGENTYPERAHNEYIQILTELGIVGGIIFLIFIFGILKLGIIEIYQNRQKRSNILTQAAFAGIVAFLVSSCFSSFSFRLMQNGIVFFFLVAILLRNQIFTNNEDTESNPIPTKRKVILVLSILACFSLTIYSAVRATSQYLTNSAENTADFETSKNLFENAMWLDSSNASAQLSYGAKLLNEKRFDESSVYLRNAIDNGIGTSSTYFTLALSQSLGNDKDAAKKTLEEALRLYPYSYFLHLRYALLLKESDFETSQKHLTIAKEINPKQSETWWIFLNEGAKIAFEKTKNNKDAVPFTDLIPNQLVNTVIFERQTLDPTEKISFGFNN